ncbi:MAG: TM2 domain-containing protein, partial [Candidatus Poseidoniaceae archaeon]
MQPPNPRNVGNATLQDSVVGGDLHTGNIIHNHYHVTQTPAPVQTSVQETVTPPHLQEPQQSQVVYVNSMNNSLAVGEKDLVTAYLLCIFFGWLGGHRFYLDQFNMGLLYVFTFGFLGFGTLIDLILLPELV